MQHKLQAMSTGKHCQLLHHYKCCAIVFVYHVNIVNYKKKCGFALEILIFKTQILNRM